MLRLAALLICLAGIASAGAWPREEGKWFTATSTQFSEFEDANDFSQLSIFNNFYMEYGLKRSITLGLDIGHSVGFDPNIRVFARAPVFKRPGVFAAVEASLGRVGDLTYTALGANYGQGFTLGDKSGWFGIDTRIVSADGPGAEFLRQGKADLTAGLTYPSGIKAMAQLFHTQVDDAAYTSFAPSIVVPVGERIKIQGGLLFDLQFAASPGLKIGLWQEF